ncbi:MAG: L-serine ammonia-lyase, iron-sulfur-dependent, subunit alpha [Acetatifactor sp.]|nr:L-serine ammonia-lyase, iron-sulfur-dependent, subunit alpha [Acetatifactor sp.]
MNKELTECYIALIKEELIPAMGCTEPIALAYGSAIARRVLGQLPERIKVVVSGNIIKNVKSVIVPHTGGMRGIEAAVAAGLVAGVAEDELEVLSHISEEQVEDIKAYYERFGFSGSNSHDKVEIAVEQSASDRVFEIDLTVEAAGHNARVWITDHHTHVEYVSRDGQAVYEGEKSCQAGDQADRSQLTVERIVEFAETVDLEPVKEILDRQIAYNTAIAKEGLTGKYGAGIGRVLMLSYGDCVSNRAKAWAAAGSDARMNGCELPVVINSGSGNQGMTASLPVIVYARELGVSQETLYRALLVSNLVTIHLKTGIGCLSAYCGATSAGCGAGAGVTYLYGGRFEEIAHTVVNAVAINSGVVCDGAKASCAAKIASAVEAGLLGMQMYLHGRQFLGGDGIVTKGVEATIRNVSELAREGMRETDREILRIMLECSGGSGACPS